jgi:hypothetical protein
VTQLFGLRSHNHVRRSNPLSGNYADRIDDGYRTKISSETIFKAYDQHRARAARAGSFPKIGVCFYSISRYKETSMCNKRNDSDQEHVPAVLSRREVLKAGAAAAIIPFFGGANSIAQATESTYTSTGEAQHAAMQ